MIMKNTKHLFAGAALAAAFIASPASAAEFLFDFVGDDPDVSAQFVLDSVPMVDSIDATESFTINGVSVTRDSGVTQNDISFFTLAEGGGFDFDTEQSTGLSFFGPQLFSGTLANPSFLTGSFDLTGNPGTLTISSFESAVPEPGTWLLMILGFGFVGAGMRRRKQAVKLSVSYN